MNLYPGDIVVAASGREKGGTFAVIAVSDNFAFICDGKSRKIDKPKKKKIKHLSSVIAHSQFIEQKLVDGGSVTNRELKRELNLYAEHNL